MENDNNNLDNNNLDNNNLDNNNLEAVKQELIVDDEVEDILDELPKMERDKVEKYIIRQSYSGPLPSPQLLREFDNVEEGTAKKIIDNFVTESDHRRQLEIKSLEYSARDVKMGAWFGFILGLVGLIGGFLVLLFTDHTLAGSVLSGGSLVALVTLFLRPPQPENPSQNIEEKNIDKEES